MHSFKPAEHARRRRRKVVFRAQSERGKRRSARLACLEWPRSAIVAAACVIAVIAVIVAATAATSDAASFTPASCTDAGISMPAARLHARRLNQLQNQHTYRPPVTRSAVITSQQACGRHVLKRTARSLFRAAADCAHIAAGGTALGRVARHNEARHAKVAEQQLAGRPHQKVTWLHVAVEDARRMALTHRIDDLQIFGQSWREVQIDVGQLRESLDIAAVVVAVAATLQLQQW
eukprot:293811-Chlamydomonas_euryale.AAC.8